jgi:hypothetical protein
MIREILMMSFNTSVFRDSTEGKRSRRARASMFKRPNSRAESEGQELNSSSGTVSQESSLGGIASTGSNSSPATQCGNANIHSALPVRENPGTSAPPVTSNPVSSADGFT